MSRDQIIISGGGLLLLALLAYGYFRYVRAPIDTSAPGNSDVLQPARIKPADVFFYAPPVQNIVRENNRAPAERKSCGCMSPW